MATDVALCVALIMNNHTRLCQPGRKESRPLEHVERSGNGGYISGPSGRRLQNMYSGYKTRLAVTIRQFPFAPDTFYAFTAVLSILSRPPLKRRLTLRSAAVRTRDLSARGLLGAGHDPKSSEPRGEEAPSSRPRSDTLSGVLYNRAATLLSYVP